MAINNPHRGFALLISVIFMSVMLSFGLALASLGYKQQVLASSAIGSQYAFYAADAALECVLYADQQLNLFAYADYNNGSAKSMSCDGTSVSISQSPPANSQLISTARFSLDSNKRCADITIYKPSSNGTSYLFAQGYDVPCTTVASSNGARFVSRGLTTRYTSQ